MYVAAMGGVELDDTGRAEGGMDGLTAVMAVISGVGQLDVKWLKRRKHISLSLCIEMAASVRLSVPAPGCSTMDGFFFAVCTSSLGLYRSCLWRVASGWEADQLDGPVCNDLLLIGTEPDLPVHLISKPLSMHCVLVD